MKRRSFLLKALFIGASMAFPRVSLAVKDSEPGALIDNPDFQREETWGITTCRITLPHPNSGLKFTIKVPEWADQVIIENGVGEDITIED